MNYKLFSAKSGKSIEDVKKIHTEALKEADCMGVEKSLIEEFCSCYIEDELDLDNIKTVAKNLNDAYLRSKHVSFSHFMEYLMSEDDSVSGGTISSDFASDLRPETALDVDKLKNKKDKENENDNK